MPSAGVVRQRVLVEADGLDVVVDQPCIWFARGGKEHHLHAGLGQQSRAVDGNLGLPAVDVGKIAHDQNVSNPHAP